MRDFRPENPRLSLVWHAVLAFGLVVAGCQPALRPPALVTPVQSATAVREAKTLWGQVVAGYSTQATSAQLVSYATVTLLDASNQVVATGLTDAAGAFGLNPFVSWTPTTNAVYVLDALKSFDRTNDRAGLRFRTLVSWDGSQWRSIAGTTSSPSGGSGVQLSAQTTAVAAIQSLRAVSAGALLGTLNPVTGAFTAAGGVTASEVSTVTSLVNQALAANLDPVAYLSYTAADGSYRLKLSGTSAGVLFDLEDAVGNTMNNRSLVRGRDGGQAIAFSNSIAYYQSQFGSFGSAAGLFNCPMGLDTDRYGNVYVAEHNNHRVQKFSPEGRLLWSVGSSGSQAVQFQYPTDVRVDDNGNILVCDYLNHRIQKLDPYGNLIFGIGGGARWTGSAPAWSTVRNSGQSFFQNPHFAKFDAAGNIWVGDSIHNRVLKYDPNGNFLMGIGGGVAWSAATPMPNGLMGTTVANATDSVTWGAAVTRTTEGLATDGTYAYIHDANATNGGFFKVRLSDGAVIAGPGSTPYLNSINGAMAYVNGKLYYRSSTTGANKILVIDTTTMSEAGYLLQNGSGTITSANNDAHPWSTTAGWASYGLTTEGRYLYIPEDTGPGTSFTVHVYDPFNNMAWVKDVVCPIAAGTMSFDHHGYYTDGDYFIVCGYNGSLSSPRNFRFRLTDGAYLGYEDGYDPFAANLVGACYDYVNQRILRQEHASGRIAIYSNLWRGTGNGWFNLPTGLAIAPSGEIYVCDRANNRIQRFDASGTYLGQWGSQGTGNGQFDTPDDLAIDNAGNVWVGDGWGANSRIQKFDRLGTYLGQMGSPGAGNGQFDKPRGLAFAPDGTLLVSEWGNNRVQRLVPASPPLISHSSGHFNAARGTISLWFKPSWNGTDATSRVFFRENGGTTNSFGLHKMGTTFYLYATDNTADPLRALRIGTAAADTARLIKAGEWHHLAVTWDGAAGQLRFFLNGTEYASYATNMGTALTFSPSGMFSVGSEPDTTLPANSVIDDFRIFDYPKSAEEILRDSRGLAQE